MTTFRHCNKPGLSQFCNFLQRTTLAATCLVAPLAAQNGGFVTIDAPGAGTVQNQGTTAFVINQKGVVAGYYVDSAYAYHGFVRSAQGVITEFDAPRLTNTEAMAINTSGQIVGNGHYQGSIIGQNQGFLRVANGGFGGIHPPDSLYTSPTGINDSGEIAGTYYTHADVNRGFITASSNGVRTYTLFDEPDASSQPGYGTYVSGINTSGEVFGNYVDATVGAYHGFTRDGSGNFVSFEAPGAGTGQGYGTIPLAINRSGEIVGYYSDSSAVLHGFVRDASGNITDFDPPGSTQTFAYSINDNGEVVGFWAGSQQVEYGFFRDASGNITTFTVPAENIGVQVLSLNNAGQMTGFYYDMNGGQHGFLWQVASVKSSR